MTSKSGKVISGETRTVILRVLSFFEAEKEHKSNFIPVSQAIKRTSVATGVSRGTLARIKDEAKKLSKSTTCLSPTDIELPTPVRVNKPSKRLVFSKSELNALKEIVERFETPSLRKILEVAKTELNYKGGLSSLRLILYNELGLKFGQHKHNKVHKVNTVSNHQEENHQNDRLEIKHGKEKSNEPMDFVEVVIEPVEDSEKSVEQVYSLSDAYQDNS